MPEKTYHIMSKEQLAVILPVVAAIIYASEKDYTMEEAIETADRLIATTTQKLREGKPT